MSLWVMAKILATSELEAKESGIFLHFLIFMVLEKGALVAPLDSRYTHFRFNLISVQVCVSKYIIEG